MNLHEAGCRCDPVDPFPCGPGIDQLTRFPSARHFVHRLPDGSTEQRHLHHPKVVVKDRSAAHLLEVAIQPVDFVSGAPGLFSSIVRNRKAAIPESSRSEEAAHLGGRNYH
jgi:hypothetical protein